MLIVLAINFTQIVRNPMKLGCFFRWGLVYCMVRVKVKSQCFGLDFSQSQAAGRCAIHGKLNEKLNLATNNKSFKE